MKRALMTWGGWPGHEPEQCVHLFAPYLRAQGYDVTVSDTLETYLDAAFMRSLDLIVPVWTQSAINREQLAGLLGAVASGVGIAGWRGYEWLEAKRVAESGTAFEQAVTLAESGKAQEAEAAFAKLANDGTAGYRVLSRLREAAELARSDPMAAIKAYEEIAADRGAGQVIQDLATLRAGLLLVDQTSYADLRSRLESLTGPGRAFRYSARELLALSAWKQGDASAAKQWTEAIIGDPQTPAGARKVLDFPLQVRVGRG